MNAAGAGKPRVAANSHGPTYLRWVLIEPTIHALKHPAYTARYRGIKHRLGKQRGGKVSQEHAAWVSHREEASKQMGGEG